MFKPIMQCLSNKNMFKPIMFDEKVNIYTLNIVTLPLRYYQLLLVFFESRLKQRKLY